MSRGPAELRLEPSLEAMNRGLADLMVHEQHVFAPFEPFIAAAEHLMRSVAAEEPGSLKADLHHIGQT